MIQQYITGITLKGTTLKSIIPSSVIAAIFFVGIAKLTTLSKPVALIITGVVLIGFANIGKIYNKKS
jgi:hypothetical protein